MRQQGIPGSGALRSLREQSWLAFVLVAILLAPGLAGAQETRVDLKAPIEDAILDAAMIDRVCAALRDGTPQQQYDAARYSDAQSKKGITAPALLSCLVHSVEYGADPVKAHAGFALKAYGSAAVPGLLDIVKRHREDNAYWVAISMLWSLGPAASEAQTTMLRWMNAETATLDERLDAAKVVWAIDDPASRDEAFAVMLSLSDAADLEIAAEAAIAMSGTERPEVVPTLLRCAHRSPKSFWSEACVLELGNLAAGPRNADSRAKARSALASLRDDPDPSIRDFAGSVSEWIGP